MKNKNKFYLTENNDKDIAFAISCLFCQCLTFEEFKLWLEKIIKELNFEDIPPYIFELYEYEGTLAGIFEIIGFDPRWSFSKESENALYGISYKRNIVVIKDFNISEFKAKVLLEKHKEIESYYRKLFDFISW